MIVGGNDRALSVSDLMSVSMPAVGSGRKSGYCIGKAKRKIKGADRDIDGAVIYL